MPDGSSTLFPFWWRMLEYYSPALGGGTPPPYHPGDDAPANSVIYDVIPRLCFKSNGSLTGPDATARTRLGQVGLVDSYIELQPSDPFTMVVAFNLQGITTSWNSICEFGYGNAGRQGLTVGAVSAGQLTFGISNGANLSWGVIPGNTWYILVVRYDGSARLRGSLVSVDGSYPRTDRENPSHPGVTIDRASNNDYIWAHGTSTGRGFDNSVQNYGLWKREFSDAEVNQLMTERRYQYGTFDTTNEMFFYPCDDVNPGVTGSRDQARGNDLTVTGGTEVLGDGGVAATDEPVAGDAIIELHDYLGGFPPLRQEVLADRPVLQEDVNGWYLDCAGDKFMFTPSGVTTPTITQPHTSWCVGKFPDTGRRNFWSRNAYFKVQTSNFRINAGVNLAGVPADANPHVWSALFNGSVSENIVDGVARNIGDAGSGNMQGQIAIAGNASGGDPLAGIFRYLQLSPGSDVGYRQKVENYLGDRYGITITHPVDPATDVPAGTGIYEVRPDYCYTNIGIDNTDSASYRHLAYQEGPPILANEDGSFSVWVRFNDFTNRTNIFSNFLSPAGIWLLTENGTGDLKCAWGVTSTDFASITGLSLDTLYHIVGKRIGGVVTMRINDSLEDSNPATGTDPGNENDLYIGQSTHSGASGFSCAIAQPLWFKGYDLTPADITWLYNGGAGRPAADIAARFGSNLTVGHTLHDPHGAVDYPPFAGTNALRRVSNNPMIASIGPYDPAEPGQNVTRFADSLGVLPDFLNDEGASAPVLLSDGKGWHLATPTAPRWMAMAFGATVAQPTSIIAVADQPPVSAYVLDGDDTATRHAIFSSGGFLAIFAGDTKTTSLADGAVTGPLVTSVDWDDPNTLVWGNGTQIGGPTNAGGHSINGLTLLCRFSRDTVQAAGPFRYMIVSPNGLLSDAQRQNAEQWLVERYLV